MKLIQIIFFTVLSFTVYSCSSDDDNNSQNQEEIENDPSLIGTWDLIDLDLSIQSTTTSPEGIITVSNSEGNGSNITISVTFNENPNIATLTGTYSIELTTEIEGGQTTTQTFNDLTFENIVGEWSLNDNQLVFNTPLNFTNTATINTLTETTLSYDSVLEETSIDNNNNSIVNIIIMNLIYNR